jgi:hypothetical protein
VDNWKNITKSPNSVRKKSFGGTFCFSNCHIIGLDTGGLVFLVSGSEYSLYRVRPILIFGFWNMLISLQSLVPQPLKMVKAHLRRVDEQANGMFIYSVKTCLRRKTPSRLDHLLCFANNSVRFKLSTFLVLSGNLSY